MNFQKLYVVIDKGLCKETGIDPTKMARFFVDERVPFIEYMDTVSDQLEYHKIAWEIRQATWGSETKFIVNGTVQYAIDMDADGVYLSQEDLKQLMEEMEQSYGVRCEDFHFDKVRESELMKERLYKEMLFGISISNMEERDSARKIGNDLEDVYDGKSEIDVDHYELAKESIEIYKHMITM